MNVMLCGKSRMGIETYTALAALPGVHVVAGAVSTVRDRDQLRDSFAAVDLPVVSLVALRDPETWSFVAEHGVDLIVLANVSTRLHPDVRAAAPRGALCFHPSLLPRYPGHDAVAQTIAAGDTVAGVTIFDPVGDDLDSGPIVLQQSCTVPVGATASTLYHQLVPIGVRLMALAVANVRDGIVMYRHQKVLTPALQSGTEG